MTAVISLDSPQYSVYQKIKKGDGTTEWVGTHRLPIKMAIETYLMFREHGYRAVFRKDGEPGPSHKD